jgi:hypothetical protein
MEMNKENDAWDNIVNNWQHGDVEAMANQLLGRQLPSNQVLEAKVKRDVRTGIIETVLGVIMGLVLSGYITMEIINGLPSITDYVLYSCFLAIGISVSFFSVWLKRDTWGSKGDDSKAYLHLLLNQANSHIKLIKMSKVMSILMFLVASLILILIFGMWLTGQNLEAKHAFVSIIVGLCCLIFIGIYVWMGKARLSVMARKQQLESMLKEMQ